MRRQCYYIQRAYEVGMVHLDLQNEVGVSHEYYFQGRGIGGTWYRNLNKRFYLISNMFDSKTS